MSKLFALSLCLVFLSGCDRGGNSSNGNKAISPPPEEEIVPEPFDPDEAYPDAQPLPIGVVIPPVDPDDAYPDAQPLPIGIVVPIPQPEVPEVPEEVVEDEPALPEPKCITLAWTAPEQREDGTPITPEEINFYLIVRVPADADDEDGALQQLQASELPLDRLMVGDPLVSQIGYLNREMNTCDDLGLERGDYNYWFSVIAVDTSDLASDYSDMVHPNEDEWDIPPSSK